MNARTHTHTHTHTHAHAHTHAQADDLPYGRVIRPVTAEPVATKPQSRGGTEARAGKPSRGAGDVTVLCRRAATPQAKGDAPTTV
jgi:hypothetical protein